MSREYGGAKRGGQEGFRWAGGHCAWQFDFRARRCGPSQRKEPATCEACRSKWAAAAAAASQKAEQRRAATQPKKKPQARRSPHRKSAHGPHKPAHGPTAKSTASSSPLQSRPEPPGDDLVCSPTNREQEAAAQQEIAAKTEQPQAEHAQQPAPEEHPEGRRAEPKQEEPKATEEKAPERKLEEPKAAEEKPAKRRRVIDIEKAVATLLSNAHGTDPTGFCAKYVRIAIESAGPPVPNRPISAKDYGPCLLQMGFVEVPVEKYVPEKGDVVVLQPPKGTIHGHIQMYDGSQWVSDFRQLSPDVYPGKGYRHDQVSYAIYRP